MVDIRMGKKSFFTSGLRNDLMLLKKLSPKKEKFAIL